MLWIVFTLVAMLLWSAVNILDKYIIGHELRDPILVTTIFGFSISLLFIFLGLFTGAIIIPVKYMLLSMLGGLVYATAIIFYYSAMKKIEVSRIVPIIATEPLIIAIVAFFLFGESLKLIQYIGIGLIVFGAILITHKKYGDKVNMHKFYAMAFLCTLLFGLRNILIKYVTIGVDFWPMLFWLGVGMFIAPLILLFFHHPHIREQAKKGVLHLCLTALLSGLALIFFTKAISIGSVSLASALLATKPMLVFFIATFLSFFHPDIIVEKHTKKVLLKKMTAVALIVAGGIFVLIQ